MIRQRGDSYYQSLIDSSFSLSESAVSPVDPIFECLWLGWSLVSDVSMPVWFVRSAIVAGLFPVLLLCCQHLKDCLNVVSRNGIVAD